ncbi:MAG TPA: FG-GAP-like repeat-containing protein [Polyangiaceae bacterium]|nr:FG-GAP-like repeat-containing protein [Polyangiaceae bacterium]
MVTALLFVAFAGACGGDTGGPVGEARDGGDVDASVATEAEAPAPDGGAPDAGRDARNDAVTEDTGRPDAALSCGAETECRPAGAAAYCANTSVDKANCGACGKSCRATSSCAAGRCLACSTVLGFPGPPLVDVGWGSVVWGDVNGDGKLDLVVADNGAQRFPSTPSTVGVLMNSGTGTFAPRVDYPASTPISVAVGDVNGDGKPDLVVANGVSGTVSVLVNSGTGTFAPRVDYPTGTIPMSVALGDVDGDGKLDLVVSGPRFVSVLVNSGTGTFGPGVLYLALLSHGGTPEALV